MVMVDGDDDGDGDGDGEGDGDGDGDGDVHLLYKTQIYCFKYKSVVVHVLYKK